MLTAGCEEACGASGRPAERPWCGIRWVLAIEREIQLEHVDARLAEEAERPALGVRRDEAPDIRLGDAALARDARHLELGRRPGEMCGSKPDADVVTRSIGTGAFGFSLRARPRRWP